MSRYIRARLGSVFSLTTLQFKTILTEHNGDEAWLSEVERHAGFKFEACECPSSAMLVVKQSGTSLTKMHGEGEVTKPKDNTLAEQLGQAQVARLEVPEAVFDHMRDVQDPTNNEINDSIMTAMSNAVFVWLFCKFGKFNVGLGVVRQCAMQLRVRAPKLKALRGESRTWDKVLANKAYLFARQDALVSPLSLPRCLHALHTSPHLTWLLEVTHQLTECSFRLCATELREN